MQSRFGFASMREIMIAAGRIQEPGESDKQAAEQVYFCPPIDTEGSGAEKAAVEPETEQVLKEQNSLHFIESRKKAKFTRYEIENTCNF